MKQLTKKVKNMAKAKQHRESLLSGGRMDNVIKDYLWRQKYHRDDITVLMHRYGKDYEKVIFDKSGKHYRKIAPVMARVYNPVTKKVESVNIREHNKRVFSGKKRKAS